MLNGLAAAAGNLTGIATTAAVQVAGPSHPLNWTAGWALVLAGFASGALIGLGFHKPDFLGGYGSLRRRMLRLGHIALAALGLMNVVFALSPWPPPGTRMADVASICWLAGGVLMPLTCFAMSWREGMRRLFPLPVAVLMAAAVCTLLGAP